MLALLPAALRGGLTALLLLVSTLLLTTAMLPPALAKLLVPVLAVRRACDRALTALAATWVAINNGWIAAVRPDARWDMQGLDGLRTDGWYLVSSNHLSAVDILVLQRVFHGRIPFLKFFLKRELFWVPVIGLAWWALDFPFMKRGRGAGAQHADLRTTRESCEKFKRIPTSVINFVEGTRATPEKRERTKSPYRHLLKPKIGGLGIALATMGELFDALLDVTIVYPEGTPTLWGLLCGRVGAVIVRVQRREIAPELRGGDPVADKAYRVRIGRWMERQWQEKDALIDELLGATPRS